MRLKNGTIVLVVDGSRMLLLRNEGDAAYPDLKVIEHRAFHNPPNRELLGDAPGLSYSSGGFNRSSYDNGEPHQRNATLFAISAAELLSETAKDKAGDIVVVAPPHTLAVLRDHFDDGITSRLVAEIDKDLTKHPVEEITKLLMGYE